MRLQARLARLEAAVPRSRTDLPADTVEFIRGLAAGRYTADEIDRTGPDLMSLLARVAAVLVGREAAPGRTS